MTDDMVCIKRSELKKFYDAAVKAADTLWQVANDKMPVDSQLKYIGSAIHEVRSPVDKALGLSSAEALSVDASGKLGNVADYGVQDFLIKEA